MFVLGTAGHIDHGKSVLVRALTGIDPDRLAEEKERGMTIDLGFAWLRLPSGREVGIVDVPGHERFVKNMLAGVGGIDMAMLVVAANESVMPQTREHLAILDLLDISRGVVAITKKDLVDDEWLDLVRMEVEELLTPTSLADSPIVTVSAVTGEGLSELVAIIDGMLAETRPRRDMNRARMPVDRVFTMAGAGTVVTGTLIDGHLSVGEEVEILPVGLKTRVRSLQQHRSQIQVAEPGSRVAANLVGVSKAQIQRGDVLARPGWLRPTSMMSARFRLLRSVRRPLRHNARLTFYTGAAEAIARVRLLEADELKPGESAWVQLLLDRPMAVANGDHFIIRSTTDTLGGGRIMDTMARRLRRFRPAVIESLRVREEGSGEEVLLAALGQKQPLTLAGLSEQSGLSPEEAGAILAGLGEDGRVVSIGKGEDRVLFTTAGWDSAVARAVEVLHQYHERFPARPGMPRVELGGKITTRQHAQSVVSALLEQGKVVAEGPYLRLPEHRVRVSQAQQSQMDAFMRSLHDSPYAPPADRIPEPDVLALLTARGEVVKVTDDVVFSRAAYEDMVACIREHIKTEGRVTLAEVRDMFKTSRKYAQALLEELDRKKITRRVGDERVLY